jgi:hypothetical protein
VAITQIIPRTFLDTVSFSRKGAKPPRRKEGFQLLVFSHPFWLWRRFPITDD